MLIGIGISGKQFAGKDTFADLLLGYLPWYKKVSLAGPLKEEYAASKGYSVTELEEYKRTMPEVRKDLIDLGMSRRSEDPEYWVKKVLAHRGNIVVPDIRFQNEVDAFNRAFQKFYLIRLESPESVRSSRGRLAHTDDVSETELDDYDGFSFYLTNDSSYDELMSTAKQVANMVLSFQIQVLINQVVQNYKVSFSAES